MSSGAYTNRTQSELMQLDADDDDDDYNGEEEGDEASEALREKVTEAACRAQRRAQVLFHFVAREFCSLTGSCGRFGDFRSASKTVYNAPNAFSEP